MKALKIIGILLITSIMFSGCFKENQLTRRLDGSWNIYILKKTVYADDDLFLELCTSANNVGNISFDKDGTGDYHIAINLGEDLFECSNTFQWENTASTVTIYDQGIRKEYEVDENSQERQVWIRTLDPYTFIGMDSEVEYRFVERITLIKI